MTIFAGTDGSVQNIMGGETVLAYKRPVVGGGEVSEVVDGAPESGFLLTGGFIALQSESHPIQFRRIAMRLFPDG